MHVSLRLSDFIYVAIILEFKNKLHPTITGCGGGPHVNDPIKSRKTKGNKLVMSGANASNNTAFISSCCYIMRIILGLDINI